MNVETMHIMHVKIKTHNTSEGEGHWSSKHLRTRKACYACCMNVHSANCAWPRTFSKALHVTPAAHMIPPLVTCMQIFWTNLAVMSDIDLPCLYPSRASCKWHRQNRKLWAKRMLATKVTHAWKYNHTWLNHNKTRKQMKNVKNDDPKKKCPFWRANLKSVRSSKIYVKWTRGHFFLYH